MKTFTILGVRYRLVRTGKSRWGPGKIHLQYYSREYKQWMLSCRPQVGDFSGYYLHDVDDVTRPVTCKPCQRKDPR